VFVRKADIRNRARRLHRLAGRQDDDACAVDDLVQNLMSESFKSVRCYKGMKFSKSYKSNNDYHFSSRFG
jgi:hypothetical protein